jgi:hypothetical protein
VIALSLALACTGSDADSGDSKPRTEDSAGETGSPPDSEAEVDPRYTALRELVDAKCVGCHSGGWPLGGLGLVGDALRTETIDVPAQGDPNWTRVVCGESAMSALYTKTVDPVPFGGPMPEDAPALTGEEQGVIAAWIDGGCP